MYAQKTHIAESDLDIGLGIEHLGLALADAKDSARTATATGTATATEQAAGTSASRHAAINPHRRTDQEQGREETQDRLAERNLVVVGDRETLAERDSQLVLRLFELAFERLDGTDAEVVRPLSRSGAGRRTGRVRVERDADPTLVDDGQLVDEAFAEEGRVELGPGDLAGRGVVLRREPVQDVHGDGGGENGRCGRVWRLRRLFGRHAPLLAVPFAVLVVATVSGTALAVLLVLVGTGTAGRVAGLLTEQSLERVLGRQFGCTRYGRSCTSGKGIVLGVVGGSLAEEAAEKVVEARRPLSIFRRFVPLLLVGGGWRRGPQNRWDPCCEGERASIARGRRSGGGDGRPAVVVRGEAVATSNARCCARQCRMLSCTSWKHSGGGAISGFATALTGVNSLRVESRESSEPREAK